MPQGKREQLSVEQALASGAWALPAWHRLKRQVEQERIQCWLLVVVTAIAALPAGTILAAVMFMPLFLLAGAVAENIPGIGSETIFGALAAPFAIVYLLGILLVLTLPAAVIITAIRTYNRQLQLATRDFVHGNAALMLIDESYGQIIEQSAQERYRPNPNRVDYGKDFVGRVNHFAHYYAVYFRLSYGPSDISTPYVIERNCWSEGPLLALGLGLTSCLGLGLFLTIPIGLRTVFGWTRILAVKQAVVEYLGGKYDAVFEPSNLP